MSIGMTTQNQSKQNLITKLWSRETITHEEKSKIANNQTNEGWLGLKNNERLRGIETKDVDFTGRR